MKNIIEAARIKAAEQRTLERELERERNRFRDLSEAHEIINSWQKTLKRKTKVNISISAQYISELDRTFYTLRLFVKGEPFEIYRLEASAAIQLISGIEPSTYGGVEIFTLFSNKV